MDVPAAPLAPDRSPDDALLRRVVRGDDGAFATLYDRHAPYALAAARRILGPTPAAEDAVQDALLQLWTGAHRYEPRRGTLRAWLVVLARSRALDLLRRENVRSAAAGRLLATTERASAPSASDEAATREVARDLRTGLATLPADQRHVLGLMYLGGRTQEQVAGELGAPLGTIKGRSRLGLMKLRRELEPRMAVA